MSKLTPLNAPDPCHSPALPAEKGSENFLLRTIQRNSLKSLNSDERIQGNPSESNVVYLGFKREKSAVQANPNNGRGDWHAQ